jgi:heat-inducible transcriptional repressor
LAQIKQLTAAERNAIESLLSGSNDLDETLGKTVRLLSRLTNQIAMVQYPTLGKSKVRSIDIIAVTETKALLILVTDIGRIEQHMVQLGAAAKYDFLQSIRNRLNAKLSGKSMSDVQSVLADFEKEFDVSDRADVLALLEGLKETVDANRTEKLLVAGAANLARRESDFSGSITPLLDALEEQVVLLRLIGEMQVEQHGVSLRIGRENQQEGFSETSVVVTGYETGGAEVARLGVIGPTRMDYSNNMAAVLAVAKYLTRSLEN